MRSLTLAQIEMDANAIANGHSHCLGCGAQIPVGYDERLGQFVVHWTCATRRCNYLIEARMRGWSVIEGGASDSPNEDGPS